MTSALVNDQPFVAFTIVAHNYLPRAQLLCRSFRAHHPSSRFFTVVIDHPLRVMLRQTNDASLVSICEIDFGSEGFEHMATGYEITEFATAVKPFALRHFLRDADCVIYLDPDIEVYAPLDPLVASTRAAGISLTPHALLPLARDGGQPSEPNLLAVGVYNLGYIGVASQSLDFVDWWAQRLRRDALNDPQNFVFTDQKWIDLSVPLFRPHIETDPGYNAAYWNLDQRPITCVDGTYFAGGSLLRFFHFSGYDPSRRHWISKFQPFAPRVLLSENASLRDLFNAYGDRLDGATDEEEDLPYGWGEALPGLRLTDPIRRAYHHDLRRADEGLGDMPPCPFLPGQATAFVKWVSSIPRDSLRPIPRYLLGTWEDRPDVRIRMPETVVGDTARLRTWTATLGGGVDPNIALLGWRPEGDERFGMVTSVGATGSDGVNLVGFLRAELEVGEAGRLAQKALAAADVAVTTVASERTLSRQAHPHPVDGRQQHNTVLMAVGVDQLPQVHSDLGPEFFAGRHVIGQLFWELADFPASRAASFALVDEVWAATEFIRAAVAKVAPAHVTVNHLPLPFITPETDDTLDRNSFGLDDRFMFLFTFDMMSVFDRKNPLGLVAAYRNAFEVGDGAQLVLKTLNGMHNAEGMERVRWACMGRPDIVLLDEALDRRAVNRLTALSDCYVSLHRSEGLGLAMAEAMLLGKPIIATAYSGNMDFMTDDTAYLVPWELRHVPASATQYATSATWAEPDLSVAAALMRRVVNEPVERAAKAAAARRHVLDDHSSERCGAKMRRRLEQIWTN